jgi:hypothetical protein
VAGFRNDKRAYGKAPNSVSEGADKVNSLWPNLRLLIALHSPDAVLETGLRRRLREKSRHRAAFAAEQSVLCSPVCGSNNREIRALFAYFGAKRVEFLRSRDCMAEREGFELSVRFCRAKARRVRKLQIAKPYQRIPSRTRHQIFAISPVSIRRPFGQKGERQAILWQKVVTA